MGETTTADDTAARAWRCMAVAIVSLPFAIAGCSGSSTEPGAADAAPDPTAVDCLVAPVRAEIGTCIDQATGDECYLAQPQDPELVTLEAGQTLDMVRGPQGADMFVMGLRTSDLTPGGVDLDHPAVNIDLSLDGERIANYRASIVFTPDDGADTVAALGLFVVLSAPGTEYEGKTIDGVARISDREDNVRCGRVSFVAGKIAALP